MADLFAVLGESPRPWLDPEELKARYHQLAAQHHPDVSGAVADFAEINRAYAVLSEPAARLRHLLELEAPGALARAQPVPAEIAAFFTPVAETRQVVDAFLKKSAAAVSPLARALLATEQCEVQERLEEMLGRLQEEQEVLLARVREVDALWQADRAAALGLVPALWQGLSYTARWQTALREPLHRLAGF